MAAPSVEGESWFEDDDVGATERKYFFQDMVYESPLLRIIWYLASTKLRSDITRIVFVKRKLSHQVFGFFLQAEALFLLVSGLSGGLHRNASLLFQRVQDFSQQSHCW